MQSEKLLELTRAMKLEILDILFNHDLSDDVQAQRTILTIDRLFSRLNIEAERVVPLDVLSEYYKGVDEATKALGEAGVNPKNGLVSSMTSSGNVRSSFGTFVHYAAIMELTDNLMLDLRSAIRTARQNTYFTLMTTLADVKEEMQRGLLRGNTRREITKRVAMAFEKNGMTSFITRDNRRLPLDFYSDVVVRTNLRLANVRGAINRYEESDVDYVQVSVHSPTCHECYAYKDMVFCLSGDDDRFLRGTEENLPPYHPNCRCTIKPFVIEFKSESEIQKAIARTKRFNPKVDSRSPAQRRAYEREQKAKARANYEKKRYATMKSVLGDKMPKTLGGFRRSMRANSKRYRQLSKEYREELKKMRG